MATAVTVLGLTALATVQSDDVLPIVDVHDATQSAAGSTKKITVANLLAGYLPLSGGTLTGGLTGTSLTLSSGLNVGGVSSLTGNITAGGALSLSGALTLGNVSVASTSGNDNSITFTQSGPFKISSTLGVTGAITTGAAALASAAITGNTTVGGTLAVTGTTTLGGVNTQSLTATALQSSGALSVTTDFAHKGSNAGFYNTTARAKPTITGPINTADLLAQSLVTILVELGLLSTTTAAGSYFVT